LTRAKAISYNVPFVDLTTTPVSPGALSLIPQEVAQRFKVFPIAVDEGAKQITVAMADPLDLAAIEFIEQKSGMFVKPFIAEPSKIESLVASGYSTSLAKEVTEALKEVSPGERLTTLLEAPTSVIREEKLAEIVSHLSFAMSQGVHVHIEPQEKSTVFATELTAFTGKIDPRNCMRSGFKN
jgi:type IV pilus assembly protein PilB